MPRSLKVATPALGPGGPRFVLRVPPIRRGARLMTVGLLVLGLAGACANDGRDLAEPKPWQTTTTRPPPTTSAPDREVGPTGLTLTSPGFAPGGDIPVSATCAGANVFPDLAWTGVPANTVELALSLADQTDPSEPVLLWLMAGIDPSNSRIDAGTLPIGAFETLNGPGNPGYGTPCLESLPEGRRDLQFRVHALIEPSGVAPGGPGDQSWEMVKARSVESASLLARITAGG